MPLDKLTSITFDQLLREQDPFGNPAPVFDLTGVQMVTPVGLVQLAAACFALDADHKRPVIVVPDTNVRSYLLRAGFSVAVESIASIEPLPSYYDAHMYDSLRGSNPLLIEVTKMESGGQLPPLLDQVVWVLRHKLKYLKNDAFDIATAISEICQNTFDHNRTARGFLAMQVYGAGEKRFLEIGVADYGDGLAKTLGRNPKIEPIKSDVEAIQLATKLGVSEYDDPTRGTGLYHILEIAYEHRGLVQIRSGNASIRFRMDDRRGYEITVPYLSGVQIALNLPTRKLGA